MAQTSLEEGQRTGGYISAFPNVGLVVWQAGFVLAEWLIRTSPLGHDRWPSLNILELGCGVGQLGIPLACTGAKVTLTDLPHIIPLTEENVRLNAHAMPARPRVMPFVWGTTEPAVLEYGGSGGCNASAEQSTAHAAEHASKPAAGTAAAAGHEEVNPDLGAGIGGRVGGERRETAAGVAAGQPACSSGVWSKEGDSDAAAAGGAGSCGAAAPEQQGLLDMVVAADVSICLMCILLPHPCLLNMLANVGCNWLCCDVWHCTAVLSRTVQSTIWATCAVWHHFAPCYAAHVERERVSAYP